MKLINYVSYYVTVSVIKLHAKKEFFFLWWCHGIGRFFNYQSIIPYILTCVILYINPLSVISFYFQDTSQEHHTDYHRLEATRFYLHKLGDLFLSL